MAFVHGEQQAVRSDEDMVGAFALLYHHAFSYIKTMALKCAVELGIPDAIHGRGGAATLAEIANDTGVHESRLPDLRCLMKLLTTSGLFRATAADGGEVASYGLTVASSLVVGPRSLSNMVRFDSARPGLPHPVLRHAHVAPDRAGAGAGGPQVALRADARPLPVGPSERR